MAADKISGFKAIDSQGPSARRDEVEARRMEAHTAQAKDPRVLNVAKQYEKQFMMEMVKAMRQSVGESGYLKPSMAEGIYREQLDEQYVDNWGESGGMGITDLIYNEIMEKFLGRDTNGVRQMKSQGPLPLSDKDILRARPVPSQGGESGGSKKQVALEMQVADRVGRGPLPIRAPWSGTLLSLRTEAGRTSAVVDHGQGLKSTIMFEGIGAHHVIGENISQGEVLGLLSPDARRYLWNMSSAQVVANTVEQGLLR